MISTRKKTSEKESVTDKDRKKPCLKDNAGSASIPFTTDEGYTDTVILRVEGKDLFVSRGFLAMASPVFYTMFSADFKEKSSKIIELKGKTYKAMLQFLLCLHPCLRSKVTGENVYQILSIAHEYQHTRLLERCQRVLKRAIWDYDVDNDACLAALKAAELYNLTEVIDEGVESLSGYPAQFYRECQEFLSLTGDTRSRILNERLAKLGD